MKPAQLARLRKLDRLRSWKPFTDMREYARNEPLVIERAEGRWLSRCQGPGPRGGWQAEAGPGASSQGPIGPGLDAPAAGPGPLVLAQHPRDNMHTQEREYYGNIAYAVYKKAHTFAYKSD